MVFRWNFGFLVVMYWVVIVELGNVERLGLFCFGIEWEVDWLEDVVVCEWRFRILNLCLWCEGKSVFRDICIVVSCIY